MTLATMHRPLLPRLRALSALATLASLLWCCSTLEEPSRGLEPSPIAEIEELGRLVFIREAQPPCANCHTLRHADAWGITGSDLDSLMPTFDEVKRAVETGVGAMPSQAGLLTEEQIDAVSRYVSEVAGQ